MNNSSVRTIEFNHMSDSLLDLIYCNGIHANYDNDTPVDYGDKKSEKEKLIQQVGIISEAFGNRKLTVFNNPTTYGEFASLKKEGLVKEQMIANQFADFIRKKIELLSLNRSQSFIHIIAHSHGAWITKIALEVLTTKEREFLKVYTFGGVTVIPKNLAFVVENYLFKGDMIARCGNKKYGPEGVLERVINLSQRSLTEKVDSETLFYQFREVWYGELDSSNEIQDSSERNKKNELHLSNFWYGDPNKVTGFEERYKKFLSCLNDPIEKEDKKESDENAVCLEDYEITLLSPEKTKESSSGDFSNMQFLKQKIAIYGEELDKYYHTISAYKKSIGELASRIIN